MTVTQRAALRFASAMSRRRFLHRAANVTFAGAASLAAGRLFSPSVAYAYTASCETPTGAGCPKGCGSDPCCGSLSGSCQCGNGSGGCLNDGFRCHGLKGDWYGSSCWTCTYKQCQGCSYVQIATTCCDCYVTGCGGAPNDICIAWHSTTTVIGTCSCAEPGATVPPPGTVVGVATGDPTTSWGVQPPLAPAVRP